ncbi:hypothetical protein GCM10017083_51510 [Thalassobaculum fulvum]|uniref:Uncharacterized protein n=1 Tax=Thalassobaculum fulvum TaxID=1633335 RepID=A0A918XXE3_9PROT|nr:hypothetical protein [Thalassobaculum fulvum]GHD62603.1 hypothetical protein GCM10017083_51510 [Thalassobaculum fulvum]
MIESMQGLLGHGDAAMWGMGWGRFAFAVGLLLAVAVLVRLTLFRHPQ